MTTYTESFGTAVDRKGRRSRRDVTRSSDNLRNNKDCASNDAVNGDRTGRQRPENSSETPKRKKSPKKKTGKGRSVSTSQLDGNFEEQEKPPRPPSKAPETGCVQNGGHVIEAEGPNPTNLPEAEPEPKTEKKKNKNKKLGRRSESRTSVLSTTDSLDEELVSERSATASQGQKRSTSRGQRLEVESGAVPPFDLTSPLTAEEEKERRKAKKKTKKVEEKAGVEEEEEEKVVVTESRKSDDVWLLFGMKLDVLCKFLLSDAVSFSDTSKQGQKVNESLDVIDAELFARAKKAPDKLPTMGEAAEDEDDGQITDEVLLDSETRFEGVTGGKQADPCLKERRKKGTKQYEIKETPQEGVEDNRLIVADLKVRNDSEGQRSRDVNQIRSYHQKQQNVSPATEQHEKALRDNGKTTVATATNRATPTTETTEATTTTGTTGKTTAGRERQRNISREVGLDSSKPETEAEKIREKSQPTNDDDYDDDNNLKKKQNSRLRNESTEMIKIDMQNASTPTPPSPSRQSSPRQPSLPLPPPSLLPPLPPAPRVAPPPPRPSTLRSTGKRTLKPAKSEESLVMRRQQLAATTGREAEPEVVTRRAGGSLRGAVSVERLAAGEPPVMKRRSLSREWKVTTLTTREEIVFIERGRRGRSSAAAHAQSSSIERGVIETGNRCGEEGKKKMEFEYIDCEEKFGDFFSWPSPPASPPPSHSFSPPSPPNTTTTTTTTTTAAAATLLFPLTSPRPRRRPPPPPPTAAASTTLPLPPLPGEILPAATSGDVKREQRRSDHVTAVKPEILGRKPTLSLYLYRNRSASASRAREPTVQKSTKSEKSAAPIDPSDLADLSSTFSTGPPFCSQTDSSSFEIEPQTDQIEIQRQTGNACHPDVADDRLDSVFADNPRDWHGEMTKQADIVIEALSSSQGKNTPKIAGDETVDGALNSKHSNFKTRDVIMTCDVISPTVDEEASDRFELVAADNSSSRSPEPRNAKEEAKKSNDGDQHSSYCVIAQDDRVSPVVVHEYGEYLSFRKGTVAEMEINIRRTQRQREEILRRIEHLRSLRGAGPVEPLYSTGEPDSDRCLLTTSRHHRHPLYSSGGVLDRGHSPPRERFHSVEISADPSLTAASEGVATSNRPFSDSIFYSVRNDGYNRQTEQSHRTQ